MAHKIK